MIDENALTVPFKSTFLVSVFAILIGEATENKVQPGITWNNVIMIYVEKLIKQFTNILVTILLLPVPKYTLK